MAIAGVNTQTDYPPTPVPTMSRDCHPIPKTGTCPSVLLVRPPNTHGWEIGNG